MYNLGSAVAQMVLMLMNSGEGACVLCRWPLQRTQPERCSQFRFLDGSLMAQERCLWPTLHGGSTLLLLTDRHGCAPLLCAEYAPLNPRPCCLPPRPTARCSALARLLWVMAAPAPCPSACLRTTTTPASRAGPDTRAWSSSSQQVHRGEVVVVGKGGGGVGALGGGG